MVNRAITAGWEVPYEQRPEIIAELVAVVVGSEHDRDKIGAAKALMSATKLQLDEARLNLDIRKADQDEATDKTVIEIRRVSKDISGRPVGSAPESGEGAG